MGKARALKKKVLTSRKGQSHLNENGLDFDLQTQSSVELRKQLEAKREKIANELKSSGMQGPQAPTGISTCMLSPLTTLPTRRRSNRNHMPTTVDAHEGQSTLNAIQSKPNQKQGQNKANQDQALESRKRKTLIPTTLDANEGTNKLSLHDMLSIRKTMIQPFQSKDQNSLLMLRSILQGEEDQHDNFELQSSTREKKKPIYPSMTVDQFLEKQGIRVEIEEPNIESMQDGRGGNMTSNDDFADLEVGENNCIGDQVMATNCDGGTSKNRKPRGKTTCKAIHARTWEEREEVTFEKGQPVGPTDKRVSDLTNFLGTMARDRKFVSLLYTNWHAVPENNKSHMWEYVNSKFILPNDAKKWVMSTISEAWRRYKGKIKKKHFDKYNTIEDMLKNPPAEVPEDEFSKLIKYWSLPTVQSVCYTNSQSRKKLKYAHRMGPINFARVRMALRMTKGTNEDPTKSEMFVATRSRKGKEVDLETQAAILELQNHRDAGETEKDAFEAVFGKEKPGQVRCYGRSITATDLKKDAEITQIKQQYNEEVTSLKSDIGDLKKMIHGLQQVVKILLNRCDVGMSAGEVETLLQFAQFPRSGEAGHSNPHSSGSTHVPNQEMDDSDDAFEDDGDGGL